MKKNTKKERKDNMNDNLARVPEKYTYEDYKKFRDSFELIDGKIISKTDGSIVDIGRRATYEDYKRISDEHRVELIDGEFVKMVAPTIKHQDIVGEVFMQFKIALKGKKCKPFVAPTAVVFEDGVTFEPDVLVVCDNSKIKEDAIYGAPDLIIEVLSKSDVKRDKIIKYSRYAEYGVENYIMIDPMNNEILQSKLNEDTGFYDTIKLKITDEVIIKKENEEIKFCLKDSEALKEY